MTTTASESFVTLTRGPTLPLAVIRLALRLEARGLTLTCDGDQLLVRPGNRLTVEDRAEIRRWKVHLMALVDYWPPEIH